MTYLLCFCHFRVWFLGSGVVLDCIDSWSLPHFLLLFLKHIIVSPQCAWNSGQIENAHNFFFICQLYNDISA